MTGRLLCPQPRERSFHRHAGRAGSATVNTMLTIMPMVSHLDGRAHEDAECERMENGESTVETRMALSPSAVLPENMLTHMKLTMPMGNAVFQQNSVTICVSRRIGWTPCRMQQPA